MSRKEPSPGPLVCKQCGGENEARAIECWYCGAALRQPYRGDPLGRWLESLDEDFTAKYVAHWSGTLSFLLVIVGAIGLAALSYFSWGWEWQWAAILGAGVFATGGGLSDSIGEYYERRRRRDAFFAEYWPQIEAFCRTHDVELWRVYVLAAETLRTRRLLRVHLLLRQDHG